jgi:hypothetical protein
MGIRGWPYLLLGGLALVGVAPFLLRVGSASGSAPKPPPPPQPNFKAATPSGPVATTTFVCGEVAMTNVTLTADENCPGTTAIFIGKAGITINLNGHFLAGDATSGHNGIWGNTFNSVTIENGVILNFDYGVALGANSSHVTNLLVENNTTADIAVGGSGDTITGNTAVGSQIGIEVFVGSADQGGGDQVSANTTETNSVYGVYVTGAYPTSAATISTNKALNNSGYGIAVTAVRGTATGNVANGNHQDGIYLANNPGGPNPGVKPTLTATGNRAAFNGGLGFNTEPNGAVDGGGNVVQDNTNPMQCANIVCHEVDN